LAASSKDEAGDNILEHVAGIEDYTVARAAYEAAVARWPGEMVTLRQGARVVFDSRAEEWLEVYGNAGLEQHA
jgi:hypothetical protein